MFIQSFPTRHWGYGHSSRISLLLHTPLLSGLSIQGPDHHWPEPLRAASNQKGGNVPFQDKEQACLLFAIKAASAPGSVYVSKMKSIWALCTAPADSQDKGNSYQHAGVRAACCAANDMITFLWSRGFMSSASFHGTLTGSLTSLSTG